MKIIPLGNRIVVKQETIKTKTSGGIYLPEQSQEKSLEGIVISISDNNYDKDGKKNKFNVSCGNRVTFAIWGSELEFKHDGDTYVFINEDSIIGLLK